MSYRMPPHTLILPVLRIRTQAPGVVTSTCEVSTWRTNALTPMRFPGRLAECESLTAFHRLATHISYFNTRHIEVALRALSDVVHPPGAGGEAMGEDEHVFVGRLLDRVKEVAGKCSLPCG